MTDFHTISHLIVGLAGLAASCYAIAVTARRMNRRHHAVALQVMMIGVGLESIALLFENPVITEAGYLGGMALIVIGAWAIILTRRSDERNA